MKFKEFLTGVKPEQKEQAEEIKSQVLLHFTRHGEKTKIPGLHNKEQELTPGGKKQAYDKGSAERPALNALAYGSDIKRAQQAAGFEMAGATGTKIGGNENLEELKQKLNIVEDRELNYGTRLGSDIRLGFHFDNKQFEEVAEDAYGRHEGLKWMVENSDELAKELNDTSSTTYLRAAGGVAQILNKYENVSKNFSRLLDNEENREKYGQVLERFIGSHSGLIDLFLTRAVEKIKGQEERDKLIDVLGNQGFDFAEGFDVEIDDVKDKNQPTVRIRYEKKDKDGKELFKFDEEIPPEVMQEMIEQK